MGVGQLLVSMAGRICKAGKPKLEFLHFFIFLFSIFLFFFILFFSGEPQRLAVGDLFFS